MESFLTQSHTANFSCKIMSEHDDLSAYIYLPLAYVCEAQANFNIVLSDKFIPSYLDIHQSPQLSNFLVEVCGLLKHRADHLSARLSSYQQAVVDEFVDFHAGSPRPVVVFRRSDVRLACGDHSRQSGLSPRSGCAVGCRCPSMHQAGSSGPGEEASREWSCS